MKYVTDLFFDTLEVFLYLSPFLFLLLGCSGTTIIRTEETKVRDTVLTAVHDTTLTVRPPVVLDTLEAMQNPDSSIVGVSVDPISKDTTAIVRYIPKKKRIEVEVHPDTIRVQVRDSLSVRHQDTLSVTHNTIEEKDPLVLQILGLVLAITVIGGLIFVAVKLFR